MTGVGKYSKEGTHGIQSQKPCIEKLAFTWRGGLVEYRMAHRVSASSQRLSRVRRVPGQKGA